MGKNISEIILHANLLWTCSEEAVAPKTRGTIIKDFLVFPFFQMALLCLDLPAQMTSKGFCSHRTYSPRLEATLAAETVWPGNWVNLFSELEGPGFPYDEVRIWLYKLYICAEVPEPANTHISSGLTDYVLISLFIRAWSLLCHGTVPAHKS